MMMMMMMRRRRRRKRRKRRTMTTEQSGRRAVGTRGWSGRPPVPSPAACPRRRTRPRRRLRTRHAAQTRTPPVACSSLARRRSCLHTTTQASSQPDRHGVPWVTTPDVSKGTHRPTCRASPQSHTHIHRCTRRQPNRHTHRHTDKHTCTQHKTPTHAALNQLSGHTPTRTCCGRVRRRQHVAGAARRLVVVPRSGRNNVWRRRGGARGAGAARPHR